MKDDTEFLKQFQEPKYARDIQKGFNPQKECIMPREVIIEEKRFKKL